MLERMRSRLNSAIVAHRALVWVTPSAAVAAAASAVLKIVGIEEYSVFVFAVLLALGAAAGAFRGSLSRMGTTETARWLDEKLGGEELFSAALVCLGRGRTGRFDDAVLEQASALVSRAARVGIPVRPTLKKAAVAFAASAAAALALMLVRPLERGYVQQGAVERSSDAAPGGGAPGVFSDADIAASSAALASSIFPDDKRMATLAERALREGRMDDFRDILKGADIESTSQIERAVSELEKRKLTRDREQMDEGPLSEFASSRGGRNPEGGAATRDADGGRDSGDSGGAEEGALSDESWPGMEDGVYPQDSAGDIRGDTGDQVGGQGEFSRTPGYADALAMGGEGWGVGSSSDQHPWGDVEAAASDEKITLGLKDETPFFELILPGENASTPLSSVLPSSRRAAESAMSREGVPYEYLDFVRSYFMVLTKGVSE
jgi:hypothetical protein